MNLIRKIISLILVLTLIDKINCDYFTSIVGLEKIYEVEKQYVQSLETHLYEVEQLNQQFVRMLQEAHFEQQKIRRTRTPYFEQPVNAFKTLKRFVVEWKRVEELAEKMHSFKVFNETTVMPETELIPPTMEDLKGAARGLSRLQDIYKLETEHIAAGYLKRRKYSIEMSAFNCFILGHALFESGEYSQASEWLIEAMHKTEIMQTDPNQFNRKTYPNIGIIEILGYLAEALYKADNAKLAMHVIAKLLALQPDHVKALAKKNIYLSAVKEEARELKLKTVPYETKLFRLYNKVCSGELRQSPRVKRDLRCRYVTNNIPYYFVGPLRMEQLSKEPFVAHYYNVIHDGEIDQIIKLAKHDVKTSKVGGIDDQEAIKIRTSKNTWLWYNQHQFLDKISQRLVDITGLSIESAEPLQVANYGIGGHYAPHLDASDEVGSVIDRILTALFYINNVALGGATAFPLLHLAVPPIKGSLVVWFNLHRSLKVDMRTWHAGCPVLKGSKWICNEWFHATGQEFKRPCDLKPEDIKVDYY